MDIDALKVNARKASSLLKVMGNERRLLILCHLAEGERSVGELEDLVGLSQSALSQHLAKLRREKLVRTRRSAQTIYYSLNGREAMAVMAVLHELHCTEAKSDGSGLRGPTSPAPVPA
ncbi:MAG TPA: metalloregulator ArsR/SmtB family transcription factor [Azospirillaceae bacterium]|nr:metalloregulator ArsR/SmtB family transcription factor [Azospirillaceae bacterium]